MQTTGQLTLSTPTRITWGMRETAIDPLSVRLGLDASTLEVRDFVATAPEGRLALDGDIALGAPVPALGFDYSLDLDLTRLATWLVGAPAMSGTVHIAGRLDGPPATPVVSARLESERIGWDDLEARGVTASARLAGGRISVDEFHASLAGGTVEGAGTVTLTGDGTSGEVSLSWADLSADLLLAAVWPPRPVAVASSLTGTADASWTGHDPRAWVVTVDSRHRAVRDAVMPGIPIDGRWRLESGDGEWHVVVEALSAGAVSVTGRLQGGVLAALSETGSEPITGNVEGRVSDLRRLGADLETLGLTGALNAADLTSTGSLALVVSGTAGAPQVTGELRATGGALGLGLRVALWRVGDADPLPVEATVDLDLAGAGSMDAPRGTGRVVIRNLSFLDYAVDRVEHELRVDEDGW